MSLKGASGGDPAGAAAAAQAASAQGLVPTPVRTGPYTAAPADFVPVDISGGSVSITLPSAPADKSRIGVKVVKVSGTPGSTSCSIPAGGTDVFNIAAGSVVLTLTSLFQGVLLQYKASTGIWYVSTADTPLGVALGAAKLGTDGTVGGPSGSSLAASVETAKQGTVTKDHLRTVYGAKGDGVMLYNAVMTAGSAVLNSTDVGVNFTNADVGKTIIVSGVGASSESLVTTIASVQSASQCTLAANATVSSPDGAGSRIAVYGTDDTAAIQAASDAAAASGAGTGTVEFDSKIYMICGALVQGGARKTNAQITLPNGGFGSGHGRLVWKGARDFSGLPKMPFPSASGTVLMSTLVGQTYSATYGVPSVVGGPTFEQQTTFSGWLFTSDDICVLTPRNPSLGAFNLEQYSRQNRRRCTAGTLEWGYPQVGLETLAIAAPSHTHAAAFIDPRTGNQQAGDTDQCITWGYFVGLAPNEHSNVHNLRVHATMLPIAIRAGYVHPARIDYISCETCPYVISGWDPTQSVVANAIVAVPAPPGGHVGNGLLIDALDLEDYSDTLSGAPWAVLTNHINDANNKLTGHVSFTRWSFVSGSFTDQTALVVSGATGIQRIRNDAPFGIGSTQAAKGDQTEFAFSGWKTVRDRVGYFPTTKAVGTYLLGANIGAGVGAVADPNTAVYAFWFDPADYPGGARTTKIRVRGMFVTNAVAPGASTVFTFGLYPVATWGGASNAIPIVATVGAVVAACPAISNPAANTAFHVETAAPVTAPAAGWYVLAVALSGATTAVNSLETAVAEMQVQQV